MGSSTSAVAEAQAATRRTDWVALARDIGPAFAARATDLDERDAFVAENYAELQAHRFFSAGVPAVPHTRSCARCCASWARNCGSTALALSMHTHLLAFAAWRWRRGEPVEPLLRRVAQEQIVLVSTGGFGLARLLRHG